MLGSGNMCTNIIVENRNCFSLTFGKLGVTDLVGDGEDAVEDGR
jgi:hypothetical protein